MKVQSAKMAIGLDVQSERWRGAEDKPRLERVVTMVVAFSGIWRRGLQR